MCYFLKTPVGKHTRLFCWFTKQYRRQLRFLCTVWLRTNTEGKWVNRRPGGLVWLMNRTTCCVHPMPFFANPMTLKTHRCQLWTSSRDSEKEKCSKPGRGRKTNIQIITTHGPGWWGPWGRKNTLWIKKRIRLHVVEELWRSSHALYWNKKLCLQQHSTSRLAPTPTHLALCCQGCLSNLKIRHNPPFI